MDRDFAASILDTATVNLGDADPDLCATLGRMSQQLRRGDLTVAQAADELRAARSALGRHSPRGRLALYDALVAIESV